jgi:subtilisin family serine protease
MAKLDPGLKYLASVSPADLTDIAFESALGVDAAAGTIPRARVLVEVENTAAANALKALGFVVRTRAGFVLSGEIPIDAIEKLDDVPGLVRAECSRAMAPELDLALPEARVSALHLGSPSSTGNGVIIGIIDSGIDYQHPSFLHANGTSRIMAIWDQRLRAQPGERTPAAFNYGVEFTRADIDAAMATASPLAHVRHVDLADPFGNCHGTHVAGIAAGNGEPVAASGGATRFVGVAPEADLIVVANTRGRAQNERGLGDSADTLDAVQYILSMAADAGRPVVINQSQGDNVGPHDGTSLLEVGIAGLITGPGQVLVKSAGNEGAQNRHAQGTLAAGAHQDLRFQVPANTGEVMIDIWYPAADRIDLRVTPAGSGALSTAVFAPASTHNVTFSNGNDGFIDLDLAVPGNGDNRTFIVIRPGSGMTVQSGVWTLRLIGSTIADGRWHAWIQRHSASRFQAPFVSADTTISIPGTSIAVITAGSYISNPAGAGAAAGTLSSFSSRGPTRDGRRAPTLAAPGQELTAAQPAPAFFGGMSGTSMASPMVTGTVALMLEIDPAQTAADVRRCLEQTARLDAQTGAAPGNAWGAGKLDAAAACRCAGV